MTPTVAVGVTDASCKSRTPAGNRAAPCAVFCFLAGTVLVGNVIAQGVPDDVAQAWLMRTSAETVAEKVSMHHADKQLPPASLTKVMTALLVLENYQPAAVVVVSRNAAGATGSRVKIRVGERYTVENLLLGALLASGNDACLALAEWRDGSEGKFVVRMNQRAGELGLEQTHFANACGHDAPGHYSTAQDLAKLAEVALKNPVFADMVRRPEARFATVDGARLLQVKNSNALIGRHPDVVGVKSGYTAKAGTCLIALAERDGVRVLLVMLNAKNRWWDAHAMLDRALGRAHVGSN